ncbi:hypothetical protein A2713_02205 [candidate division WWE3 bacterium RIFCSPHIGHO2_01_FULL_35_17]|uniref:Uncharacterized protein n=1 Tax=candidate division WWE3 bacterium RIFCSPHIGHO2_01_FULL_35_17 TaxID=1802614 RepID=A0A1F4UPZ7_UNCKA|nr:MAG: hypothetical protein A2713_02205 [candidate division WWE3 bacterium RIFCSPHIGHO2_01_FULL_35_17]
MEDKIPQEEVREENLQTPIKTKNPVNKKIIWILVGLVVILGLALTYLSYLLNNSRTSVVENTPTSETSESEGISEDPTANWKTYTNEEYGFSFKYPAQFYLKAFPPNSITIANEPLPDGQLDPTRRISITVDSLYSGKYEQIRNAKAGADVSEAHHAVDVVIEKVRNFTVDSADAVEYYRDGVSKQSEIGRGFIGYERIILIRSPEDKYIQLLLTSSSVEETNQWSDTFDQILSTFEFGDAVEIDKTATTSIDVYASLDIDPSNLPAKNKYLFTYPSSNVGSVEMAYDSGNRVSGISLHLSNGTDLAISPSFEGSSISYYDADDKPNVKIISNSNFMEKLSRVLGISGYLYVTGYGEGSVGCSHWDPLPLACHMSNAYFNKIGGYNINCNTKDIAKVKMCDDIVEDLDISVSQIDL